MYLDLEEYKALKKKLQAPIGKLRLVEADKFEFEPNPIIVGDYDSMEELKQNLPSGQWYVYNERGELDTNSEEVIKEKVFLETGESAPEGFTEQRGPQGGRFYETQERAPEREEPAGDGVQISPDVGVGRTLEDYNRRGPGEGEELGIPTKALMQELLTQGTFGLISAGRNPESEEDTGLSDEQINERTEQLKQDLVEKGYVFTKVMGNYGEYEDSFLVMVHDADEPDVVELGAKYNQDSVIFTDKGQNNLIFTTGDNKGKRYVGQGHQELPAEQESFFTQVDIVEEDGPWKFTLNFDFDNLVGDEVGEPQPGPEVEKGGGRIVHDIGGPVEEISDLKPFNHIVNYRDEGREQVYDMYFANDEFYIALNGILIWSSKDIIPEDAQAEWKERTGQNLPGLNPDSKYDPQLPEVQEKGEPEPEVEQTPPEVEQEPDPTPEEALETADAAHEEIVEDPIEEEPEKLKFLTTKQLRAKLKIARGKKFSVGKEVHFDYIRKAKTKTTEFDPAGRFLGIDKTDGKGLPRGWQRGSMKFNCPLVISDGNWREELSKAFDLTGRDLSEALLAEGHDGIVAMNTKTGQPSDIVELHSVRKTLMKSINIEKPFAGFKDFADCEAKNQDKEDPGAYCAVVQRNVEGKAKKKKAKKISLGKVEDIKQLPGIQKLANHNGEKDNLEIHWADDMYYISKAEEVVWKGFSAIKARNEWREQTDKTLNFLTKSEHLPEMDTVWSDATQKEREGIIEILGHRNTDFYARKEWNGLPVKMRSNLIKDAPVVTSTPGAYNPMHRRRREMEELVGKEVQRIAKDEKLELNIEKQDDDFIKFLMESTYDKAFQGVGKRVSDQAKSHMVRMLLKQEDFFDIIAYLRRKLRIVESQAEKIARTETQAIQNGIREYAFKQSDPEDHNVYKWLGPQDRRTTDICERIKKRSGRGVKMDTLRKIVKEESAAAVSRGELPAGYDAREWTPHFQCRHRFIRAFR